MICDDQLLKVFGMFLYNFLVALLLKAELKLSNHYSVGFRKGLPTSNAVVSQQSTPSTPSNPPYIVSEQSGTHNMFLPLGPSQMVSPACNLSYHIYLTRSGGRGIGCAV